MKLAISSAVSFGIAVLAAVIVLFAVRDTGAPAQAEPRGTALDGLQPITPTPMLSTPAVLREETPTLESPPSITPTPTLDVPPDSSIEAARARLHNLNSGWDAVVAAVESEDVDGLLAALVMEEHHCTPSTSRGGDAPRCETYGVPDGTALPMFPEDGRGAVPYRIGAGGRLWWQGGDDLRDAFVGLLGDRQPQLEFVGQGADGALYLSFAIAPPVRDGDDPVIISVGFRADDPSTPRLNVFSEGTLSTVFETFRRQEREVGYTVEIWGVSDELRDREAEFHDAEQGGPPPPDGRPGDK